MVEGPGMFPISCGIIVLAGAVFHAFASARTWRIYIPWRV